MGKGVIPDSVINAKYLRDIYLKANNIYSGRVTVPILWDKEKKTIVSNESSDNIRMFNFSFDEMGTSEGDYYPENLRE